MNRKHIKTTAGLFAIATVFAISGSMTLKADNVSFPEPAPLYYYGTGAGTGTGTGTTPFFESNVNRYGALTYEITEDDTVTITDCADGFMWVDIPSEIDGLPVTSIGRYAFGGCSSLTSVTIPDSVTSIGTNAFVNCKSLTSVTIPDSVTSIGSDAFTYTPWIESKRAENPLVIVNDILMDGRACTGDVIIPDSVTSIGDLAFYDCRGITSVTIPDSVTSIGYSAFVYCLGLTSVTIPDSVTNIYPSAFFECLSLKSVTIPKSVTSIGHSTFNGCSALTSITFLNPDCEIDGDITGKGNGIDRNTDITVYGYENSTAQKYAELHGYTFSAISSFPTNPTPSVTEKKTGDVNGDGLVDSVDASVIMSYYAYLATDGTATTIEEFIANGMQ